MRRSFTKRLAFLLGSVSGLALSWPAAAEPIETVVVTAEKRSEDVQAVPLAVTALTGDDLKASRIDDATALTLAVPNMFFTRAGFGSNNYAIRGVGVQSTAATADSGITIHQNNVPVTVDRAADADFYDVDRVEVLRGPQGTQFGRNATGGVINIITTQPTHELDGRLGIEYGSYNTRKVVGVGNLPLGEMLSLRVAGEYQGRDGTVSNILTGNSVNGRNIWSTRATLAFDPFEQLHFSLMWQHFDEADDRNNNARTLCQNDPGPSVIGGVPVNNLAERNYLSLGCQPASVYGPTVYGLSNAVAGLSGAFATRFGILNPAVDGNAGITQSTNWRTIDAAVDPVYNVRNDLVDLQGEWRVLNWLKVTSLTGWTRDDQRNLFDTTGWQSGSTFVPNVVNASGVNITPGGVVNDPQIGTSTHPITEQLWGFHAQQWSQEVRFETSFDRPVNFSIGGIYINLHRFDNFSTMTNTTTAVSMFSSTAANPIPVDPNPSPNPLDPQALGHNYTNFISPYTLSSKAFFGEVYWDVLDELRFTGGIRFTDDVKHFTVYPSTFLKSAPASLSIGTPNYKAFPCASDSPLYAATQLACPFVNLGTSDAWTGKASLDWAPHLDFTDQTHIYVSLARGYKAGGFNPATLAGSPITSYAPEFIDAIEIGTKNTLLDGRLIANLTAFHYNYLGYQIGVLTAAASLTSNVNARVEGLEGEAIWQADDHIRFNGSFGLLQTSVENGPNVNQVDLVHPTAGNPAWSVVKTSNGQCVVPTAALANVIAKQNLSATGNYSPNAIRFGVTGSAANPSGLCNSTGSTTYAYAVDGLTAGNVIANGLSQNLFGRQLPSAPNFTFNVGAQYNWDMLTGWNATLRGDFHFQGSAYTRLFNTPTDRVHSYVNLNMSLTLENDQDGWLVQLYGKNVLNALQITNFSLASITFGDTTGVASLDPRIVGISVTKNF